MLRKGAALLRVACWLAVLHAFARPWRDLGGLVDERLRWWLELALWTAPAFGIAAGGLARRAGDGRRERGFRARIAAYPVACATALALVLLVAAGARDAVGVAATAGLAYTAGLDVAWNILPRFRDAPTRNGTRLGWLPPWERP